MNALERIREIQIRASSELTDDLLTDRERFLLHSFEKMREIADDRERQINILRGPDADWVVGQVNVDFEEAVRGVGEVGK